MEVAIIGLAVAVRLGYLAATQLTYEDSLISLRYAENLAGGRGLVYNPGERVFGASTPLYVLLLALLSWMRLPDPLLAAKTICALADGVTLLLWMRLLNRETEAPWAACLFAVLFGLSPLLVQNSIGGMETSLALLCLTVAFAADREERLTLLGVALGLLMVVRPDGALAALVLLAARAVRERRLPWRPALLAGLVVAPWLLFAALYYGSVVPNSVFAKAAAYNAHAPGIARNLRYTFNAFGPYGGTVAQRLFNSGVLIFLILGLIHVARRHRSLAVIPLLWLAWWAYLVLPRTLLFAWYYPPLLLFAYALAALGMDCLVRGVWVCGGIGVWVSSRTAKGSDRTADSAAHRHTRTPKHPHTQTPAHSARARAVTALACALFVAAAIPWLQAHGSKYVRIQRAEQAVREPLGRWLAANTPAAARVALEPIGYVGYYSGRRVLDEVGLVSPEMIPYTRAGPGWFGRSMRAFRPDYIVERPYYLHRNLTINSGVPMFAAAQDRAWFDRVYEPIRQFPAHGIDLDLTEPVLHRDYRFVVFRRRE